MTPVLEVRCYAPTGKNKGPHRKLLATMYLSPGSAPSLQVEDDLEWQLHETPRHFLSVRCPVHGMAHVDLAYTREIEGAATRGKPNVLRVLAD